MADLLLFRALSRRRHQTLYRLEYFDVAGAAAQIAPQVVTDLIIAWRWIPIEQICHRNDKTRGAEAALRATMLDEGLLDA